MHGRGAKLERTILECKWNTLLSPLQTVTDLTTIQYPRWAHVTHRQFEKCNIDSIGTLWKRQVRFLKCFAKSHFLMSKKGPWTGIYQPLKLVYGGGSTFGIPKNRCVKLPVSSSMCPPLICPLQKSSIFRTNGQTNKHFLFCTLERASWNNLYNSCRLWKHW